MLLGLTHLNILLCVWLKAECRSWLTKLLSCCCYKLFQISSPCHQCRLTPPLTWGVTGCHNPIGPCCNYSSDFTWTFFTLSLILLNASYAVLLRYTTHVQWCPLCYEWVRVGNMRPLVSGYSGTDQVTRWPGDLTPHWSQLTKYSWGHCKVDNWPLQYL